jgi:hypothetical protein
MRKSISIAIFVKLQHKRGSAISSTFNHIEPCPVSNRNPKRGKLSNVPDTSSLNHNELDLICRADVP